MGAMCDQINNRVTQINVSKAVIATGGRAVYGKAAMEHFKDIGKVTYLELPVDEIEERSGSLKERGVVSNGKHDVYDIFAERERLYKKYADITHHEHGRLIRETVDKLYDLLVNKDSYNELN